MCFFFRCETWRIAWCPSDLPFKSLLLSPLRMYLSSGMFYEALRNLIVNELHVPTLHVLDGKEIKAAFKQVDEKTGCCGVIDPHEVSELLLLLSQEGMDLSTAGRSCAIVS